MKLLIPVQAGLEATLKKELYALGYDKTPADNGRIAVEGDFADIARLNLFLRGGERVLIVFGTFKATTFDELYDGFYSLPWEKVLNADSQILMDGKSTKSVLGAIKAMGGVAKKAIIRRLADKLRTGRTVFSESGFPVTVFFSFRKSAYSFRKCSGRSSVSLLFPK